MRLTRLRIHGFKSFVDAADVPIYPGVTGIVGPNGCGKSNLVEALRFVMGESSYKAMRGDGMDDVIFSGSANRPARNVAEVSLLCERDTPPQGLEMLEVVRRIERDSGSVYRVNGREMRARDVQLLFADAATGAHSSALVRQGQVSELIAAKPVQRRGILEDAAGISGLHSRRSEAESKLKAAEANLDRLDDLMNEIASRLEALRRQVRQAARYRKLSEEIRSAEAMLSALQWQAAVARLADAENELAAALAAFAGAAARQVEAARQETAAAAALPEMRGSAAAAGAALQRLKQAAQELEREEAARQARREELSVRRAEAAADLRSEGETKTDADTATTRLTADEAKLKQDSIDAAALIAAAHAAAEGAAADVAEAEAEFAAVAELLAAASAERTARERAIREAQAKLRRLEEERLAIQKQRDRIQADHGDSEGAERAAAALAEANAALAAADVDAQAAETALASARETERRAHAPHEAAVRNFGALQAEARTLANLLDLDKAKRFAPLIDGLEVTPGYEKALVAALGDDLNVSTDQEAPSRWGPCSSSESDPALPEGVQILADFVQGPETLARRLRQIGIVDESLAESLLPRLATGQRLVSRDGGLWRWDGLRAAPGSEAVAARRLEQRGRAAALVQELKLARQAVDKASALAEAAKDVRIEAERIETDSRGAVREARRLVEIRRVALSDTERQASRIAERLSAFAGALARIEADTNASRVELRSAGEALQALDDSAALEARRAGLQARLAEMRKTAAETRLAADRAGHDETVRLRRTAELADERDRWAVRAARAEERTRDLEARLGALDAEVAALAETPASFEERRQSLLGQLGEAEAAAATAGDALASAEGAHRTASDVLRAAQEELSQTREARARGEERVTAADTRKAELATQIIEHFGRPAEELRALAGLAPDAPLPEASQVEGRLAKLRGERERLGGINLRAEEEAPEIEARLDSMRREKHDLEEAIKRLRQGIQSLNREGRERLLAAFETVNGHFRSLFQHLFGGGTAELTLTGSDDPLEAGLDIMARPPGKRPQTMTLLSGGEQALTALSLIFAVFLTNPSPICVLDEVDAPLDDANVERFCALLDEMRKRTETRFVVVTHNPITMARMDRLYGVTMAERGVSQIVSVDLEAAERFREAG